MFGISMWEIGLILVVALIFLGPRQLAETARVAGRWYRELQKMAWEVRSSIDFDSLNSSSPSPRVRTASQSSVSGSAENEDLAAPPDTAPGPDFYGELLENSKEDDETKPPASSSTNRKEESAPQAEK